MYKKNNRKFIIIILTGIIIFLSMIIYLIQLSIGDLTQSNENQWTDFLYSLNISTPIALLIFYIDYQIVKAINSSKWLRNRIFFRIIFEAFIFTVIALVSFVAGNLPFIKLEYISDFISGISSNPSAIAALLCNMFIITVIEFFFQYQQRSKLQEEYNHILYQQLKSQINPHFLFNSLSVIIALMNKNVEQATDYTHKLSNVYRYVLAHNEDDTITLSKELDFINNYIEILHIRYGEGLQVCIDVIEDDYNKCIPPMSLQVLIENIVKHNIISSKIPLDIQIYSEQSFIVVSNIVIPRIHTEKGMGIGLDNLKKKYKLIAEKDIIIESSDSNFRVKLPLL